MEPTPAAAQIQQRIQIPGRVQVKGPTQIKLIDWFRFAKYILNYEKLGPEHQEWTQRLYRAVNKEHRHKIVLLKPRGTYKTTLYTVTLPLWLLFKNSNLRILLANANETNAKSFLSEITGHYLRNPRLENLYMQVWNHGCPVNPHSAITTSLRLTNCKKIQKEPNIAITGSGTSIVSQHYDIIIVDDLCNREDRESPTVRDAKKKWFSDLASLLEPDGLLLMVGTRWAFDDVYSYIINELNPKHIPKDRYYVESEGAYKIENGVEVPRYPRILSAKKLEELKIDKTLPEFYANYLNNPLPGEAQLFKLHEMEFFDYNEFRRMPQNQYTYFGFSDPSLGKKESDFGAIVTIAVDHSGIIYVIDAVLERMLPDAAKEIILQKLAVYPYSTFGIEDNGFQELFVNDLVKESTNRHLYFPIAAVTNSANKKGRIESLQPLTKKSSARPAIIRFRSDWEKAYQELIKQLLRFPLSGIHDDGPDALQACVALIKTQVTTAAEPFLVGLG